MKKNILQRQNELMAKFGWFAHFVSGGDITPFRVNYHSHGLQSTHNHPDIQICYPIQAQTAHQLMIKVVRMIKKGVHFKPGELYYEILDKYPVQFITAHETDRKVLRMILPDIHGKFDTAPYNKQLSLVDNSEIYWKQYEN